MKYELFATAELFLSGCKTACFFTSFWLLTETIHSLTDSREESVKLTIYKPSLCIINEIKAYFDVRASVMCAREIGRRNVKC